jgi:hypothetical protein
MHKKKLKIAKKLELESVDCYLRLIDPFKKVSLALNIELCALIHDDTHIQLLKIILGIG